MIIYLVFEYDMECETFCGAYFHEENAEKAIEILREEKLNELHEIGMESSINMYDYRVKSHPMNDIHIRME